MNPRREKKQTMRRAPAGPARGCVLMRAAKDGVFYSQRSFEQYYGSSRLWDTARSLTAQCFLPRADQICPQRCAEMRMGSDGVYYSHTDFASRFKTGARWTAAGSTAIRCWLIKLDCNDLTNCTQKHGGAAAQALPDDRPAPTLKHTVQGAGAEAESGDGAQQRHPASRAAALLLSPSPASCRAARESSVDSSGGSLSSAPTDGSESFAPVDSEAKARRHLWSAEGAALAGMLTAALREGMRLAAERDGALQAAAEAREAEAAARAAGEAAVQREQALLAELAALRLDAAAWASRDLALQESMRRQMVAEEGEKRLNIVSARDADCREFFGSTAELFPSDSEPLCRSTGSLAASVAAPGAASSSGRSPPGGATADPPQREWTATQVFSVKKIAHWVAGFDPNSWELVNRASLAGACKVNFRWMMAYGELAHNHYLLQACDEDVQYRPDATKEPGPCCAAIYDLEELRDDVKRKFRRHRHRSTLLLRIDLALAIFELFRLQCKELWYDGSDVAEDLECRYNSLCYIRGRRQQGVYGSHPPGNPGAGAPRRVRR